MSLSLYLIGRSGPNSMENNTVRNEAHVSEKMYFEIEDQLVEILPSFFYKYRVNSLLGVLRAKLG